MSNTYSWVISSLQAYPQHEGKENVVFMVNWRREATDGQHEVNIPGIQAITFNPNDTFIPYAELKKSDVEGWMEEAIGANKIAEIDAELDKNLDAIINPPVINPALPWQEN